MTATINVTVILTARLSPCRRHLLVYCDTLIFVLHLRQKLNTIGGHSLPGINVVRFRAPGSLLQLCVIMFLWRRDYWTVDVVRDNRSSHLTRGR